MMKQQTKAGDFSLGSLLRSVSKAIFPGKKRPEPRARERGVVYVPLMRVSSARKMPLGAGEKA